jgi:dephospho-CoA kinase
MRGPVNVKVIGLTGDIACGKSSVARMLADLGAAVIDADAVVHDLQRPGEAVHKSIVAEFGERILRPDGAIDRVRLGALVFADPAKLARLEVLTHPAVIEAVEARLREVAAPAAVVEAIKLVEAGMHLRCDSLWVVTCPVEVQVERLRGRGLDEAAIGARLAAQPDAAPKLALADVVIDNGGSLANTRRQVRKAWLDLGLELPA